MWLILAGILFVVWFVFSVGKGSKLTRGIGDSLPSVFLINGNFFRCGRSGWLSVARNDAISGKPSAEQIAARMKLDDQVHPDDRVSEIIEKHEFDGTIEIHAFADPVRRKLCMKYEPRSDAWAPAWAGSDACTWRIIEVEIEGKISRCLRNEETLRYVAVDNNGNVDSFREAPKTDSNTRELYFMKERRRYVANFQVFDLVNGFT